MFCPEKNSHKNNAGIGTLDILLISAGLEVALLQLQIIEGCAGFSSAMTRADDNTRVEDGAEQREEKLRNDRFFLKDVLRSTLVQISETGQWQELRNAVDLLTRKSLEFHSLRIDNEHLRLSKISVVKELKYKRKQWQQALRKADVKITILRDRKQDEILNATMRLSYAEKWLNARAEVLELKYQTQSAPVPKKEHEERVHDELCKAYALQVQELEKSLAHWRKKYADDTARMNERLAERREQLSVAVAKREDLQKLYNLHEGEMRGWLTFKRERAARLAREEHARQAAARVQAWWRGVMVRRALGTFRYLKNNNKKTPVKTKKK